MRHLRDHPWTIAIGGAFVAAVLAELAPLRAVSRYLIPMVQKWIELLLLPVAVPGWSFILAVALAVLAFAVGLHLGRGGKGNGVMIDGLRWGRVGEGDSWLPFCGECDVPLEPEAEPEARRDRNDMPFTVVPEEVNVLACPVCRRSTPLQRPWGQVLRDVEVARRYLTGSRRVHRRGAINPRNANR